MLQNRARSRWFLFLILTSIYIVFFNLRISAGQNDHPGSMLHVWKCDRKQMGGLLGTAPGRLHRRFDSFPIVQTLKIVGDALDALNLRRYCCRRMLLAHVDLIEKLLNYHPLEK